MRLPDTLDQSLNYSTSKLKQATGYSNYLHTFDTFEAVSPIKALIGGGSGLISLLLPGYSRYQEKKGFGRIGRYPALGMDLASIFGATYLAGMTLSALPVEVNESLKQLSANNLLEIFAYTALTCKVPLNILIHTGIDALNRKSL